MTGDRDEAGWSVTTWEGCRREQLRRALRLTVRERLQGLEDLTEVSEHLERLRRTGKLRYAAGPRAGLKP